MSQSESRLASPSDTGGKRKRPWILGAAMVLVVLVLAHHPLLVSFAHRFRVDDPAPSDALVLLMGDRHGERAERAAELYRQGLAPLILVGATSETESRCGILRARGVPAGAIRVMDRVASTHDEASRTRDAIRSLPGPVHRVTLVTSSFHTARARWVFRRVLRGLGVEVRAAASCHPAFDESTWYRTWPGRKFYSWEIVKTAYYRLVY